MEKQNQHEPTETSAATYQTPEITDQGTIELKTQGVGGQPTDQQSGSTPLG